MTNFISRLCGVERDRVTAAEICIDECLTIMDRHGERGKLYSTLRALSGELNRLNRDADGMGDRYERIIKVRTALTTAFPMTDEDLEAPRSPQATATPEVDHG